MMRADGTNRLILTLKKAQLIACPIVGSFTASNALALFVPNFDSNWQY